MLCNFASYKGNANFSSLGTSTSLLPHPYNALWLTPVINNDMLNQNFFARFFSSFIAITNLSNLFYKQFTFTANSELKRQFLNQSTYCLSILPFTYLTKTQVSRFAVFDAVKVSSRRNVTWISLFRDVRKRSLISV